jgi:hypothetical protein
VATVTTLAVHDERERCTYCQHFHAVETGGRAAAIAEAVSYLDAVHRANHVRKVQSELRGLGADRPAAATAPAPEAPIGRRHVQHARATER